MTEAQTQIPKIKLLTRRHLSLFYKKQMLVSLKLFQNLKMLNNKFKKLFFNEINKQILKREDFWIT